MVEKFTLTQETRNDDRLQPQWFKDAMLKRHGDLYCIYPLDYPYTTINGSLKVKTLAGWKVVNFGDTIVNEDNKLLVRYKDPTDNDAAKEHDIVRHQHDVEKEDTPIIEAEEVKPTEYKRD